MPISVAVSPHPPISASFLSPLAASARGPAQPFLHVSHAFFAVPVLRQWGLQIDTRQMELQIDIVMRTFEPSVHRIDGTHLPIGSGSSGCRMQSSKRKGLHRDATVSKALASRRSGAKLAGAP
ncbi:hypothetical protein AcW1_010298 [Taiwanofungus camphoratus]|nr:hypothetical protein AcW2_010372 [Antrodia cinnamomea]KAI0938166.1 hypothetical protein AcV7_010374 [Antrodia cinnamomea]KAI0939904.1 hypothetical protein AcV5_010426 [Antrodia cinnamomea]KAI0960188.1 hypothetical protein AcW1_010298 [Antrodia cinnamomea]